MSPAKVMLLSASVTRIVFVSPSAIAPCKIGKKSAYCFVLRFTPGNAPLALAQKPLLLAICAPVIELTLLKSQLLILTLLKSSAPVNALPKTLEMSTLGLSVVFGAFACMDKNCSGVRFLPEVLKEHRNGSKNRRQSLFLGQFKNGHCFYSEL